VGVLQHLIALNTVTQECGLDDVAIKTWLAPVNAVIPGSGFHIYWQGLWMERAPGLSLNQLAYLGRRDLVETLILKLLQENLNTSLVIQAAIYDLLFAQCDRHAQNVFIDESGKIKLIDNLQTLRYNWEHCAQDSIFLPGTQKSEIVRYGGNSVSKRLNAKRRRAVNPLVLLDYRCYAPKGKIGVAYPPQVTQCLRKLSALSPVEMRDKYGFTDTYIAEHLVTRAADMLSRGFEWTLKRGKPKNRSPLRFKWQQPCCKLRYNKKTGLECAHAWNVTAEFPLGDPLRGGPWTWPYKDPGKYNGDETMD